MRKTNRPTRMTSRSATPSSTRLSRPQAMAAMKTAVAMASTTNRRWTSVRYHRPCCRTVPPSAPPRAPTVTLAEATATRGPTEVLRSQRVVRVDDPTVLSSVEGWHVERPAAGAREPAGRGRTRAHRPAGGKSGALVAADRAGRVGRRGAAGHIRPGRWAVLVPGGLFLWALCPAPPARRERPGRRRDRRRPRPVRTGLAPDPRP